MTRPTDLFNAAKDNDINKLEHLLTVLSHTEIERSGALREAAKRGNAKCVQLLCKGFPVSDQAALWWACTNGHLDCVQILVNYFDPKIDDSYPLYCATRVGHSEIVDYLIPLSNAKSAQSRALARAAAGGQTQCVALLIPVSDPKSNNSHALQQALLNGHTDCSEMLYTVSDPYAVLNNFDQIIATQPYDMKLDQAYTSLKSLMEKEHLQHAIGIYSPTPSTVRKM